MGWTLPVRRIAMAPAVLGVVLMSHAASAQSLKVGDAAPPLKVGKWVKGEPVTEFAPGTVYVLEFWATWCGPCVTAIPHVTKLQKEYEGKVVVIGQNVWERDESQVVPFVERMGDKMDYRVVMDDKTTDREGAMATTWMAAAGQRGIPCSMIVDQQGRIAWIGHPMSMDAPLAKIVAGNFDAVAEAKAVQDREKRMEEGQKKLMAAIEAKDADAALAVIDELAAGDAELTKRAPYMKYQILLRLGKAEQAAGYAGVVYDAMKDDAQLLNQVAWMLATADGMPTRDLDLALRAAERAAELTKRSDADILDTLARVHFERGEKDKAIEVQTEAVERADDAQMKASFTETLEKYKSGK